MDTADIVRTAAVLACVVAVVSSIWIFYDSYRNRLAANIYRTVATAVVVLTGAAVTLVFQPALMEDREFTRAVLINLGIAAGAVALASLVLYVLGIGLPREDEGFRCPACNRLLDTSWDRCPYCQYSFLAPAVDPPSAVGAWPEPGGSAPQWSPPEEAAPVRPVDRPTTPVHGWPGASGSAGPPLPPPPGPKVTRRLAPERESARTQILRTPTSTHLAWLVFTSGSRFGHELRLTDEGLLGRNPELCAIVLDDPAVSEQHTRISFEGGQFVVYDLGSTNGTIVNGSEATKQPLVDGDRLTLGETELVFIEVKEEEVDAGTTASPADTLA